MFRGLSLRVPLNEGSFLRGLGVWGFRGLGVQPSVPDRARAPYDAAEGRCVALLGVATCAARLWAQPLEQQGVAFSTGICESGISRAPYCILSMY